MVTTERILEVRPSRRTVMGLTGLGLAGVVVGAGCARSEKATGDAVMHGGTGYEPPPKGHFNLVDGVTSSILGDNYFVDLVLTPGAMYRWSEKKWVPMLAERWKTDRARNTFSMTLRKGLTWSDGKPITSSDVVTTYWCLRVIRNVIWDYISDVRALDEQTVEMTLKEPSTVVERYILRQRTVSDATYAPWAERARKLFSDGDLESPEGKKLNEEFQAFRPDEVIASGPFNYDYDSVTDAQLALVRNPKGYAADKVKFDRIVVYGGETPDITPIVMAKDIDFCTHGFPAATAKQFVKKGYRVIRPPVYSGPALLFNIEKLPEFADVRVRRAFAHVIDRRANGEVALGQSGKGVHFMAGFSDNTVPEWLSEADRKRLRPYEHDPAEAERLLESAGWTKQGERWLKPDGTPASYEIIFPAEYSDWSASGTNVAGQLEKFGIPVQSRGVNHIQQPVDVDKGNFELAIQSWGASDHPHPHFSFVQDLFTHNIPTAANQGGSGMGFELKQRTETEGEIDLEKVVIASGTGLDEAAQKKNVTTAALAFNELLPMVPLFERYGNNPVLDGDRVTGWPEDDDPLLQNAPYADNYMVMLMYAGRLRPVTQ